MLGVICSHKTYAKYVCESGVHIERSVQCDRKMYNFNLRCSMILQPLVLFNDMLSSIVQVGLGKIHSIGSIVQFTILAFQNVSFH